jgi:uncharacterized membrane protein HdeD (DUF308 family)
MPTFALPAAWWTFALRGSVAALFGAFTVGKPELTLATFVLLFAWYAFVVGGLGVAAAVDSARRGERWRTLLFEGAFGLGVGAVLFLRPGLGWAPMVTALSVWGLMTGALELVTASRLRARIAGEWLLALAGVESVALGVWLALAPDAEPLKVVFWLGAYAFFFGVTLITVGLRLRGYNEDREERELHPTRAP